MTGASSGIGQAVAIALAEAGADVAVNYAHDEAGARLTAERVRAAGTTALVLRGDVSKESDVQALFRETVSAFGAIDIVVANAGIQQDAPLTAMTLEQWQGVIGVNLTGNFLCLREAVREFRRHGPRAGVSRAAGKILCMSSVHDVIPWTGHANYTASKGGISMLMKSVAQEVAPDQIRVNAIAPGAIRTPLNRPAWDTPEACADLMRLVPYNRIGEPADIGHAAVWLASDYSDYVTGATLYVDGGMTLFPSFEHGG